MIYRVSEIFPTVQGEGCNTGTPVVLVRLQGCDLACEMCDTEYAQDPVGGKAYNEREILEQVQQHVGPRWVLLTGGEPTIQDLTDLCKVLHGANYRIALETNGNWALRPGPEGFDWICVSPKLQYGRGLLVDSSTLCQADELKFVVGNEDDLKAVHNFLRAFWPKLLGVSTTVCLQPESLDPAATQLCYEDCVRRGWRLSIQVHKLINIR